MNSKGLQQKQFHLNQKEDNMYGKMMGKMPKGKAKAKKVVKKAVAKKK